MEIEIVKRRPSGFRIKIKTKLIVEYLRPFEDGSWFRYTHDVEVCDIGKRKFRSPMNKAEKPTSEELHKERYRLWKLLLPADPKNKPRIL